MPERHNHRLPFQYVEDCPRCQDMKAAGHVWKAHQMEHSSQVEAGASQVPKDETLVNVYADERTEVLAKANQQPLSEGERLVNAVLKSAGNDPGTDLACLEAEVLALTKRLVELEQWRVSLESRLSIHIRHHDNPQVPMRGAVR